MRERYPLGFGLGCLLTAALGCGVTESPAVERVIADRSAVSIATAIATLTPAMPAPEAAFGAAMALDGDRLVVGAPGEDAAYVFVRDHDTWAEEARLTSAGASGSELGHAVAIAGDRVVLGAPKDGEAASEAGALRVFERDQGSWVEQGKLIASDAAPGDFFGSSVALSGDEILAGGTQVGTFAPGFAHVFRRDQGAWIQDEGALVPQSVSTGAAFGVSVAIAGDTAVIGAYFNTIPGVGEACGSAFVYRRIDGVWTEEARLVGAGIQSNALVGRAVAISGDTALVGAPSLVDLTHGTGAVFVFRRTNQGWEQEAKLIAGDGGAGDELGISVALSGETAVLGSHRFHDGKGPGSAYVFTRSGHTWLRQARVDPEGGDSADRFGSAVVTGGDLVLVGARGVSEAAGSVHAYRLQRANGEPCAATAECASGFCVDGVCCDSACGGGDPSDCQACSTAFNASANGTCVALDPSVVCAPPPEPCGRPRTCDGEGLLCPAAPKLGTPSTCDPPADGGTSPSSVEPSAEPGGCAIRPLCAGDRAVSSWALAILALLARRRSAQKGHHLLRAGAASSPLFSRFFAAACSRH
jgi:hypothetical protein